MMEEGDYDSWSGYPAVEDQPPQYRQTTPPPIRQQQPYGDEYDKNEWGGEDDGSPHRLETRLPPLPPPPPQTPREFQSTSSSMSASTEPKPFTPPPIHYQFPATTTTTAAVNDNEDDDDDNGEEGRTTTIASSSSSSSSTLEYASARDDAVTRYMSTKRGTVQLVFSAAMVGGSLGAVLGKSLFHVPKTMDVVPWFVTLFLLCGSSAWLLRNPYGELLRAIGLAMILVLQQTSAIRQRYPTWPYIPSFLHLKPRRIPPFPPSSNPWRYKPRPGRPGIADVEFYMIPTILAMTLIGSTVGGSIPLLPTWMGGLLGAGTFAVGTTLPNARGDLCRLMGMRVVATVLELWEIQMELEIIPKIGTVSGKVMDKVLILDRKHRIKDRMVSILSRGYAFLLTQTSNAAAAASTTTTTTTTPARSEGGDRRRRRDPGQDHQDDRRRTGDGPPLDRRRGGPPPRGDRRRPSRPRPDQEDDMDRGRSPQRGGREEQDYSAAPNRRPRGGTDENDYYQQEEEERRRRRPWEDNTDTQSQQPWQVEDDTNTVQDVSNDRLPMDQDSHEQKSGAASTEPKKGGRRFWK
jgi:hypothetical protein